MSQIPRPGEKYRDLNNKRYQIVAVAEHAQTGEPLVVYQALYGEYGVYVQSLATFMEEADRENDGENQDSVGVSYPKKESSDSGAEETNPQIPQPFNPLVLTFIETRDFESKLELLSAIEGKASQEDMDLIYESLDLPRSNGSIEEQMQSVEKYLEMRKKFEGRRLR